MAKKIEKMIMLVGSVEILLTCDFQSPGFKSRAMELYESVYGEYPTTERFNAMFGDKWLSEPSVEGTLNGIPGKRQGRAFIPQNDTNLVMYIRKENYFVPTVTVTLKRPPRAPEPLAPEPLAPDHWDDEFVVVPSPQASPPVSQPASWGIWGCLGCNSI